MTSVVFNSHKISLGLLSFLVLFCCQTASACRCVTRTLVEKVQTSDFVAKVKLLKITPDAVNSEYHDAVIEVLSLYKGTAISSVKIRSALRTSCAFLPKENTTWIIFARQWKDLLSFDACSGSIEENGGRYFDLNEQVLSFFRQHQINSPLPQGMTVELGGIDRLKGFGNSNRFAAFQVKLKPDGSLDKITQLQRFSNGALNRAVLKAVKGSLKVHRVDNSPLEGPTTILLVVYYYPKQGRHEIFLSLRDV